MKTVRVLIGTTNPSKLRLFQGMMADLGLEACSPAELGIAEDAPETGRDPLGNAVQKARFYARWHEPVLCNDAGLYFDELPEDDPRQPGLHIRTPGGLPRLDDEGMIAYYAELIHSLGGRVTAGYRDALAVSRGGQVFTWVEPEAFARSRTFTMVDTPSPRRHPGWPLDSLSLTRDGLGYFTDDRPANNPSVMEARLSAYRREQRRFFAEALGVPLPDDAEK